MARENKPFIVIAPGGAVLSNYATIEEANAEVRRLMGNDIEDEEYQSLFEVVLKRKVDKPRDDTPIGDDVPPTTPWGGYG